MRAVTKHVNGEWTVVARHDYMPFGEEVAPPIPPQDKRLFTGKERDNETGMDYFGARYYRAGIGGFTTVDPALTLKENLEDPQRWNRYAYARNNPLRYTDPDGRDVVPVYLPMGGGTLTLTFLDTRIAERVATIVQAVHDAGGTVQFSEAFRTAADQEAMMEKYPILANQTFTSPHMVGLAFDVRQSQMTKDSMTALGNAAKEQGFGNVTVNGTLETWHFQANEFITRGLDGKVDAAYKAMLQTNQMQAAVFRAVFALLGIPQVLSAAQ